MIDHHYLHRCRDFDRAVHECNAARFLLRVKIADIFCSTILGVIFFILSIGSAFGEFPPIHGAIIAGNIARVGKLISEGANINEKINNIGDTPLCLAVREGKVEIAQLLIEKGASLEVRNLDGKTPLHLAVEKSRKTMVELLLKNRASVDAKVDPKSYSEQTGYTSLHFAVQERNKEIIQMLIDKGAYVNVADPNKFTPLALAVFEQDLDMVKFLIDKGADPNAYAGSGRSALYFTAIKDFRERSYASRNDHSLDIAEYLLTKGAELAPMRYPSYLEVLAGEAAWCGKTDLFNFFLNKLEHPTNSAFHSWILCSMRFHNDELLKSLFEKLKIGAVKFSNAEIYDLLDEACNRSNSFSDLYALYEYFISKGFDIATKSRSGRTLLHGAASSGNVEAARYLLEKGVSPDCADNQGKTPIDLVKPWKKGLVVPILMKYSGSASSGSTSGISSPQTDPFPLHRAVENGDLNKIDEILNSGYAIDGTSLEGAAPIHIASLKGDQSVVLRLLEKGANVAARGVGGATPLHLAAGEGHTEVVVVLLMYKAQVSAKNDFGWTPLHFAASKGRKDTAEALIKGGADINAVNSSGRTSLHVAVAENCKDLVEFLLSKGADSKLTDNKGKTALTLAEESKNQQLCDIITEKAIRPTH